MTADRRRTTARDDNEPGFPKGIGKPATRALVAAGYASLDDLAGASEARLASLHGVGPKALRVLRETLQARGQSFADE